ncbi:hemagglutinin repeat-containing protein [Megasphaera sp.]|uniref:hemagglutinin repeat-containing protein n=1 Tax=Megasphaera sp. TaxID=2023260 RepID=UPI0025C1BA9E|nr:hemagglutinin repeat-containing protein [Megasphaera sp.]
MTSSGKDTTLVGSQLQGQSVTVKTGGNLHIESVQDSETYRGNRSSTGISVAYSPAVDVQENFLP